MGGDVWEQVGSERRRLADEISALDDEQWTTPSLCTGWRVAEVAGHLVYLAEGNHLRGTWHFWRYGHGHSPNRMIDATARLTARASPAELGRRLKDAVDGRYRAPGSPAATALAELVVHGEDIRRPLGLPTPGRAPSELAPLLDLYRRLGRWFLRGATSGLRLEATDVDWSHGQESDQLVRGPALALLLALSGRQAAADELEGEGVAVLVDRSRGG